MNPEPLYQIIADETTAARIKRSPLAQYIRETHSPAEVIALCAEVLGVPKDELSAILARKEAGQE